MNETTMLALAVIGMVALGGYYFYVAPLQIQASAWTAEHTEHFVGEVTYSHTWNDVSCWIICNGGAHEQIGVTLPDGVSFNETYSCSYFTLGQRLNVTANPYIVPLVVVNGTTTTASPSLYSIAPFPTPIGDSIIAYTYSIDYVPQGCQT